MKRLSFASWSAIETRVADVAEHNGGEGYVVMLARFDGKPSVIVDQGTLANLLDEDDRVDAVLVHVFETDAEREAFVGTLGGG